MRKRSSETGRKPSAVIPDTTSTSLLRKVKAQEAEAWERFVDMYGPLVYRWCRVSSLQADDAGDVSQEVFATVAAKVSTFRRDGNGDSFRGWLWTITRNKIRDHFRRLQRQAQAQGGSRMQQLLAQVPDDILSETTVTKPPCDEDSSPEHRAMELVRAGVEDRTWQAFWRVVVDGQAAADVADALGVSVQAVYDAKYRICRRIRQELRELAD